MNVKVVNVDFIPSIGNIMGSIIPDNILQKFSSNIENFDIPKIYENIYSHINQQIQLFKEKIIEPIKNYINELVPDLKTANKIRPILTYEDLQFIPPIMYEPILLYSPIRKLYDEGIIYGFGYEGDLPDEDYYGNMVYECQDVLQYLEKTNSNGEIKMVHRWTSEYPDIEDEDLEAIYLTRQYFEHIIQTTNLDPTDYPNRRGGK